SKWTSIPRASSKLFDFNAGRFGPSSDDSRIGYRARMVKAFAATCRRAHHGFRISHALLLRGVAGMGWRGSYRALWPGGDAGAPVPSTSPRAAADPGTCRSIGHSA